MTTRREFLLGLSAAAAGAAAAVPALALEGAPIAIEAITLEPQKHAFIVGYDESWGAVWAETKEQAREIWADQNYYERCAKGDAAGAHCDDEHCGDCCMRDEIQASRHPPFDEFGEENKVPLRLWHQAGFSVPCSICDENAAYCHPEEYPSPDDVSVIDGEVVCHECLQHQEAEAAEAAMVAAFGPRVT